MLPPAFGRSRPGSKQRPRGPGAHATASADSVGPPRLTHERLQQYAVAHAALTAPARPTTAAPRSVAGGSVPGALRKLASQPSGLLPSPAPPQPLASAVPRPTPRRAASVAQMPSPGNPITPASALNPIPTVRFALSASGKGPPSPPARGGPPPGTVSASWDATAWTQQAPVPPRPGASSPPAHAPPPERAFGPRAAEYPARSVSAPRPAHLQGGIFGPQAWYDRHVSSHHVVTGTGAGHPGSPGVPGAQGHGGGVGTGGGPRVSGSGSARSAAVRASAPSGLRAGPAAYDTINQQTHTQPQASQQQQQQQQPAKRGLQLVEPTVSRLHVADPTRRGGQGQGRGAGLHGSGGAAPWDPGSGDPWVRRGHCHGQSQSQRALRPGSRTIPSSRQRAAALEQQLRRMQQERAGAGGGEGAAGGLRRAPSDAGTNASWWQSAGGSEASYPMTAVRGAGRRMGQGVCGGSGGNEGRELRDGGRRDEANGTLEVAGCQQYLRGKAGGLWEGRCAGFWNRPAGRMLVCSAEHPSRSGGTHGRREQSHACCCSPSGLVSVLGQISIIDVGCCRREERSWRARRCLCAAAFASIYPTLPTVRYHTTNLRTQVTDRRANGVDDLSPSGVALHQ